MPARNPIPIGSIFGRLTVTDHESRNIGVNRFEYRCIVSCECGKTLSVRDSSLKSGNTTSCGCKFSEYLKTGEARRRHGLSHTPTYNSWTAMLARCENLNATSYKRYGARGISVCERWKTFDNFLEDMGVRPRGSSIERKDSNGNYEPNNCRWATIQEQNENTRVTRRVYLNGEAMSASRAMRTLGFTPASLYDRVKSRGCSFQEAIDYYASISDKTL